VLGGEDVLILEYCEEKVFTQRSQSLGENHREKKPCALRVLCLNLCICHSELVEEC
jgi:hypothetical protein